MLNKINVEQELYKLILKKDFNKKNDIGEVLSIKDGVATIYGLNDVKAGEVIEFIDSKVNCSSCCECTGIFTICRKGAATGSYITPGC